MGLISQPVQVRIAHIVVPVPFELLPSAVRALLFDTARHSCELCGFSTLGIHVRSKPFLEHEYRSKIGSVLITVTHYILRCWRLYGRRAILHGLLVVRSMCWETRIVIVVIDCIFDLVEELPHVGISKGVCWVRPVMAGYGGTETGEWCSAL